MKTFTARNDYHGTEARVYLANGGVLSRNQIRRVRKLLCGIKGCTCGGDLSERGPQECRIVNEGLAWDGQAVIRIYSEESASV